MLSIGSTAVNEKRNREKNRVRSSVRTSPGSQIQSGFALNCPGGLAGVATSVFLDNLHFAVCFSSGIRPACEGIRDPGPGRRRIAVSRHPATGDATVSVCRIAEKMSVRPCFQPARCGRNKLFPGNFFSDNRQENSPRSTGRRRKLTFRGQSVGRPGRPDYAGGIRRRSTSG